VMGARTTGPATVSYLPPRGVWTRCELTCKASLLPPDLVGSGPSSNLAFTSAFTCMASASGRSQADKIGEVKGALTFVALDPTR
jgi:hypothetical protein